MLSLPHAGSLSSSPVLRASENREGSLALRELCSCGSLRSLNSHIFGVNEALQLRRAAGAGLGPVLSLQGAARLVPLLFPKRHFPLVNEDLGSSCEQWDVLCHSCPSAPLSHRHKCSCSSRSRFSSCARTFIFCCEMKSVPKPLFPVSLPSAAVCSESCIMCQFQSSFKVDIYIYIIYMIHKVHISPCCSSIPSQLSTCACQAVPELGTNCCENLPFRAVPSHLAPHFMDKQKGSPMGCPGTALIDSRRNQTLGQFFPS